MSLGEEHSDGHRFAQPSSFISKPITHGAKATPRLFLRRAQGSIAHNATFRVLFCLFLLDFIDVFYDIATRTGASH